MNETLLIILTILMSIAGLSVVIYSLNEEKIKNWLEQRKVHAQAKKCVRQFLRGGKRESRTKSSDTDHMLNELDDEPCSSPRYAASCSSSSSGYDFSSSCSGDSGGGCND